MNKNFLASFFLIFIMGCDPATLIIGGGTAVGTMATREKGVSGTISDSLLKTQIQGKLYGFSADIYVCINIDVQNGDVLLTGVVPHKLWIEDAEKVVWQVQGVQHVNNYIQCVEEEEQTLGIGTYTKDTLITAQIKSMLLFDSRIQSLNYSVRTVEGFVYLSGVAQNESELNQVTNYARKIEGVQKVISFIKIKDKE